MIIGDSNSYGKGKIQSVFELQDGSALFVTVARYKTPVCTFTRCALLLLCVLSGCVPPPSALAACAKGLLSILVEQANDLLSDTFGCQQGLHEIDKVGITPDMACGPPGQERTVVLTGARGSPACPYLRSRAAT